MTARKRIPPELAEKITVYAIENLACLDCSAVPGEPCVFPGAGRTVHTDRYVSGAIALKQEANAAARTPEQQALLDSLHPVPREEIEACRTPNGGYRFTRETLARWGIPWPPPAGWRQAVTREGE